jgi:hypothetical protein
VGQLGKLLAQVIEIFLQSLILYAPELPEDFRMGLLADGDFLLFADQSQLAPSGDRIPDARSLQ